MVQPTPSLGFSEAVNASLNKIFQFHGRSRRSEFWWTQLLVLIVSFVLSPLVYVLTIPLVFRRLHDTGRSGWWWGFGTLLKLAFLLFLIYDIYMTYTNIENLTGYGSNLIIQFLFKYTLFYFAIAGYEIFLLALCRLDSEPFENDYGKSPKYVDSTNEDA